MKVEISPFQMAVLGQVFARDRNALEEAKADSLLHPRSLTPMGKLYIETLDKRLQQQFDLRRAINAQLDSVKQRAISDEAKNAE